MNRVESRYYTLGKSLGSECKNIFSKCHMIFVVIQNASDQKTEMEKIKGKMAQEVSKIEERKAQIDDELKEVQVCCQPDLFD